MPTSIWARLGLYTALALLFAYLLQARLHGPLTTAGEVINLVLWLSFCLAAPVLDLGIKKAQDDAYLYYLGVSGMRMLGYMAAIGLTLFYAPAMRDRTMVLLCTTAFLCYTVVEVSTFVRKLREIFKSTP